MIQDITPALDKDSEYVTVLYIRYDWSAPDKALHRWKLIINRLSDQLQWVYTYDPSLADFGTKRVEFYADSSSRVCVRRPK
jgi:hypothetical protein